MLLFVGQLPAVLFCNPRPSVIDRPGEGSHNEHAVGSSGTVVKMVDQTPLQSVEPLLLASEVREQPVSIKRVSRRDQLGPFTPRRGVPRATVLGLG